MSESNKAGRKFVSDDELQLLDSGQAARVIAKFGGVPLLVAALANIGHPYSKTSIYRWLYPRGKNGGTGGIIPHTALLEVLEAARIEGIIITSEDLDPRRYPVSVSNTLHRQAVRNIWKKNKRLKDRSS